MPAPPVDPLYAYQWHLDRTLSGWASVDLSVAGIRDDYTGAGVRVGVFDSLIDPTHPDLVANLATGEAIAGLNYNDTASAHGTCVAGLIGAAQNGVGMVGVAPGATLVSVPVIYYSGILVNHLIAAMPHARDFDIVNMSYGLGRPFGRDLFVADWQQIAPGYAAAADFGRDGLGTVLVAAAGNENLDNVDANLDWFTAERHVVVVGALDPDGRVAGYACRGANLTVVAPSHGNTVGIATTDLQGPIGLNTGTRPDIDPVPVDYTTRFGGTSAAAPMVSGVVALMLEANPLLGWRDIHLILAATARHVGADIGAPPAPGESGGWFCNAARAVNGGGYHFSNDYGFGLIDARAAVRLAESWQGSRVSANETTLTATIAATDIPNATTITLPVTITGALACERVELTLDISHDHPYQLAITLISPAGTRSTVFAQRGPAGWSGDSRDEMPTWTFVSNAFFGEAAAGDWQLEIADREFFVDGRLNAATLAIHGEVDNDDDVFVFTDEYGRLAGIAPPAPLADAAGYDVLDAAAVSGAVAIDLTPGRAGAIAGTAFSLAAGTLIETVMCGDGDDRVTGNAIANELRGGRGDDLLVGRAGGDTLRGGAGDDRLWGGDDTDLIDGGDGLDTACFLEATRAMTIDLRRAGPQGADADTLVGIERLTGSRHADRLLGDAGANVLAGDAGNDTLLGYGGDDRLVGGLGADRLTGGRGNDTFAFRSLADSAPGVADRVTDFTPRAAPRADFDRIDLRLIDALAGGGDDVFVFVGTAGLSGAGQLRVGIDGTDALVQAATRLEAGVAVIEFELRLVGAASLVALFTAADFLL